MYRLAAIDLDGTLLTPDKEITSRSVEAIKAWRARGFAVVLATARPFYRVGKFLRTLDLLGADDYVIVFNGGIVMRADGGEQIGTRSFSRNEIAALISYGESMSATIFLYLDDKILSNRDNRPYRQKNPDSVVDVIGDFNSVDLDNHTFYKVAYVGNPEETRETRRKLPHSFEQDYEVSSSAPEFVDFVPLGTSKGTALELIGARLGIAAREMVAFGDADNDIPMLTFAGLGVAMGNAASVVKENADTVCESNMNDGVAKTLEDLLTRNPS